MSHQDAPVPQVMTVSQLQIHPYDEGPVKVVSPAGTLRSVGSITSYYVQPMRSDARGLTVGSDNTIWFSENNWVEVGNLTADGKLTTFSFPGLVANGGMITVAPDRNVWFGFGAIGDGYIGRLSASRSCVAFAIHGRPFFLTPGHDGAVWLTEYQESRIVRIASNGSETDYQLPTAEWPTNIAAGPDGAVWFTTRTGVGRLTKDGSYSRLRLDGTTADLAFDRNGTLWLAVRDGQSAGHVQAWTVAGQVVGSYPLNIEPMRVAAGDDGTIWFTGGEWTGPGNFVGRLGALRHGSIQILAVPGVFGNGLVVVAGRVWFTELAIGKYTPA